MAKSDTEIIGDLSFKLGYVESALKSVLSVTNEDRVMDICYDAIQLIYENQ